MKKSLRGLLLLMMLLLPTTAVAEEPKLPAIPVEIEERYSSNIGTYYKISYETTGLLNERLNYVNSFQEMRHSTGGQNSNRVRKAKKRAGGRYIQFPQETAELKQGDELTLYHQGYPKLKLMIRDKMTERDKTFWDFEWAILNDKEEPIEEPVQFAKDLATVQIHSFTRLSPEDRDKWITRLNEKTDYQDVYAVYHRAISRNGASDVQRPLFELLDEKEHLLTEEEIALLERKIEVSTNLNQAEPTEEKIRAAAAKTVSNLDLKIEKPKTGESLPSEVVTMSEGIGTCELTWTSDEEAYQGIAQEDTAYTAQCKIKLAEGKRLILGKSKITVNGTDVTVELTGKDGEYLVTYTFGKTEVLKKTYTVTWDPNNGTDSQKQRFEENEKLKLPECKFTPPEGKVFEAWLVNGTPYSVDQEITITGDLTIQAKWKNQPTVPDTDAPTDSDTEALRVPEYRAPQAQTVRMRASDGSGTFVEGPAEALRNVHELVVERRSPSRWELSLRDFSGCEVYSDRLMLVTVPVESFGTENLRLLVDGVYTSFSVSEDGKSVTFPAYFTKDGKRPVEDLLFASDDIEVHGNRSVLPEEGCRFVIEKKSAAKFEVNLVNARGETVHTTGPVWISFPAPDGNATHWRVKIDGRETTFEVENGRVRVAEMI